MSFCTCVGVAITTGYSLSTRWIRTMVLLLSRRVAFDVASVDVRLSVRRGLVDPPPCSTTGPSCSWRSVDVDAAVSVQRAAAMSGVKSV